MACQGILYQILLWVNPTSENMPLRFNERSHRSTDLSLRTQECPRHLYGLSHDGCRAREGMRILEQQAVDLEDCQWVDDVAKAGGSLYCFHYEATSEWGVPLYLSGLIPSQRIHLLWSIRSVMQR